MLTEISPATRRWLYGIAAAAIPLLVMLGLVGADQANLWLGLVVALLGLGSGVTAFANVTPKDKEPKDE